MQCVKFPTPVHPVMTTPGLSSLQAHTVALCLDAFDTYGGFFLGDGTGVGKGRTIAGVIRRLLPKRCRVAWVTPQQSLLKDCQRDLSHACPGQVIASMGQTGAGRKRRRADNGDDEGGGESADWATHVNIVHVTYACLRGESSPYLTSLMRWLSDAPSALIVFDEAHCAGNCSTASFKACDLLQTSLPNANVIYSTATMASDVDKLRLMRRVGLFGPNTRFRDHKDFASKISPHGLAGLELLAVDMKQRGVYVCRQLSRADVHCGSTVVALTGPQRALYDTCAKRWRAELQHGCKSHWAHLNFFQSLLLSFKLEVLYSLTRNAVASGMSVVIAVQSTGAAVCKRRRVGESALSTCEDIMDRAGIERADLDLPTMDPIDCILAEFGAGAVAEVTGRTHQTDRHGALRKVPGTAAEIAAFQSDRKHICVLSRAGSTGTSLHADTGAGSGRPRLHVILEMPWSCQGFTQQCGRTHRAGQCTSPQYVLLCTDVPSDMRNAARLMRRMRNMSALTSGERDANDVAFLCRRPPLDTTSLRMLALEHHFRALHGRIGAPTIDTLPQQELHLERRKWLSQSTMRQPSIRDDTRTGGDERHIARLAILLRDVARCVPQGPAQHPVDKVVHAAKSLLRLVLTYYPCANQWIPGGWSHRSHRWFHPVHKQATTTLLLMSARPGTHFNRLPRDVVEHIIRWIMVVGGDDGARDTPPTDVAHEASMADVALRATPEQFFNHSVVCSTALQRRLYFRLEGHCRGYTMQQGEHGAVDLRAYILGHNEARLPHWVVQTARVSESRSLRIMRVSVRYEAQGRTVNPRTPLEATAFWRRGSVLYLAETRPAMDEVALWRPGSSRNPAFRISAADWQAHVSKLYRRVPWQAAAERWNASVAAVAKQRVDRAARACCTLTVAVRDFLEHLASSTKQVVRLPDSQELALVLSRHQLLQHAGAA